MGRNQADVAATALVAVGACVAAAVGAPTAVMIVLGVALFVAPGYLLGQLLVGARASGLERVAVMTGLALAVPVLGGLLLYAARVPLHRPGWLGLLVGVTLASDAALLGRRRSGSFTWPPGWRGPRWYTVAAFAAAVLVAVFGVELARVGVAVQPQAGFTQMWLVPPQDGGHAPQDGGHALSLGVTDDEGGTTSYRLVLRRDRQVIATWQFTLADGRTWQRSVPFTGGHAFDADLYLLPDTTHLYRYVSVGGQP